jgi:hypothetical protein
MGRVDCVIQKWAVEKVSYTLFAALGDKAQLVELLVGSEIVISYRVWQR